MNYNNIGSTVARKRDVLKALLFIIAVFALMALVMPAQAQKIAKQDAKGNYYSDTTKTAKSHVSTAKETGKMFTDSKGVSYPIMLSKLGKLFYIKTAIKSGKKYNVYIKTK